ncbi:aminotransferase class V-fold PLP-dependent enzyme [Haloarcula montana]|uniref:aminotransferase class V-fold PLP-dependent enzyme n=1 Tax=Haloarcula montana TaxID=3111776 RepID=UPI002D7995DA|nr:aminotransferase class V-fold PLP-dependent enzyme [Haloarcula sp. GH36]
MTEKPAVYEDLDVPVVINATGNKTRVSGSLMRPRAADAMREAANAFVRVSDLQAKASALISDVTGSEAGYVTSGASAGMTLAAAACLAGTDYSKMASLPHADDVPNEIVVPRSHRNGYDRALAVGGAELVDVGGNDRHAGTGSENVRLWEIDAAISESTAAVAYLQTPSSAPPLADVCAVAHENGVPVIVDAAAELPPSTNLSRFVEDGADIVVFSGGKAIRGPQTTGIVAGRAELIESIALQHLDMHTAFPVWDPPAELIDKSKLPGVPRQGVGRGFKVGKEELVGLIYALREFLEEDHTALHAEWDERAGRIATELDRSSHLATRVENTDTENATSTVFVSLDEQAAGLTVAELLLELRQSDPRIFLGSDSLDSAEFTVSPMAVTDGEADIVVRRVLEAVGG